MNSQASIIVDCVMFKISTKHHSPRFLFVCLFHQRNMENRKKNKGCENKMSVNNLWRSHKIYPYAFEKKIKSALYLCVHLFACSPHKWKRTRRGKDNLRCDKKGIFSSIWHERMRNISSVPRERLLTSKEEELVAEKQVTNQEYLNKDIFIIFLCLLLLFPTTTREPLLMEFKIV